MKVDFLDIFKKKFWKYRETDKLEKIPPFMCDL